MQGLTVKEMEELRDDIKMHLDLDRTTPTHIDYWEVLLLFLFVNIYTGILFRTLPECLISKLSRFILFI